MKRISVKKTTVNMNTGEEVEGNSDFMLMPLNDPTVCQTCGTAHAVEAPHNAQSLYYQYSFYSEHGRWPTWTDAMAHCSTETKALVAVVLEENGVAVE